MLTPGEEGALHGLLVQRPLSDNRTASSMIILHQIPRQSTFSGGDMDDMPLEWATD